MKYIEEIKLHIVKMDDSDEEYMGSKSPSSKLPSTAPEKSASPGGAKSGMSARTRSSRRGEVSDLKGPMGMPGKMSTKDHGIL